MGKVKPDKKLYKRLRSTGIRKKVARQLAAVPVLADANKCAPRRQRLAVARLRALVDEVAAHAERGERNWAAAEAARKHREDAASRDDQALEVGEVKVIG